MAYATEVMHVRARTEVDAALMRKFGRSDMCVRQFLMAVALLETTYGYGWQSPEGKASNNMGAIQRGRPPCGADAFGQGDTHASGETYAACFAVYPSRAAGWDALVNELYVRRAAVLSAARDCDFDAAVRAMRASGYFEAPLSRYQQGIRARVLEIASALGEPVTQSGGTPWLLLGGVGAAAAAAYYYLAK